MKKPVDLFFVVIIIFGIVFSSYCGKKDENKKETKIKTSLKNSETKVINTIESVKDNKYSFLTKYGIENPEILYRKLELTPERKFSDFINLGICYLSIEKNANAKESFTKAVESFEMAARIAKTTDELASALYMKAGALAFIDAEKSLPAINLAARLAPSNLEIARLRVHLNKLCKNELGQAVAYDHLASLDPEATGSPIVVTEAIILAVTEGLVKVILGSALLGSITLITIVALTPPDDRVEVVKPLTESYFNLLNSNVHSFSQFASVLVGSN